MDKISLRVDPLFLILAFGLGWLNSQTLHGTVLWAVVIFISILFHELGHALTALAFGQGSRITLMAMGGVTQREGANLSQFKEFFIVLNGPVAGFILYFICSYLLQVPALSGASSIAYMLTVGTFVNLFWTLLNLAPVLPLDGGRLLMIFFQGFFGVKGVRIAHAVSLVLAVLLGILFMLINAYLAGAIFLMFAFESYRNLQSSKLLTPDDENADLKKELERGEALLMAGQKQEAIAQFKDVQNKTQKGLLYFTASLYLAEIYESLGKTSEAFIELYPAEKMLDIEQLKFLQKIAYKSAHFAEAAKVGQKIFEEAADANVALINSLSLAEQSRARESVGWFETAIREGLDDPEEALKDMAFTRIRGTPEFIKLEESIGKGASN